MAPRRRWPAADSLAVNPSAAIALDNLFTDLSLHEGDKSKKWYNRAVLKAFFAVVDPEKFRKRYKKLLMKNSKIN